MLLGNLERLKNFQIRIGSVFRMTFYPQDRVTPKGQGAQSRIKYFVIVGIDANGDYIGASLINTNVNINFAAKIAPYQLCIYPDKYEFLDGKYRYVDGYAIKQIKKERIPNEAEYIGILEDDDIEKVRELLRKSPAMDTRTLRQFGI